MYCMDADKRSHWHLDLCTTLQAHLALPDPPYFLLPAYTATIDCWVDPGSQQLVVLAEAYPRALRFRALLNTLFQLPFTQWRPIYSSPEACSTTLLETYRNDFPKLWQHHDLVIQATRPAYPDAIPLPSGPVSPLPQSAQTPGEAFVFRLFVKSYETASTEAILKILHKTLESVLDQPYVLQVIDVAKHPEQAEADQVSVTPTLVRAFPAPTRRISGDFTSLPRLLKFLELSYFTEGHVF